MKTVCAGAAAQAAPLAARAPQGKAKGFAALLEPEPEQKHAEAIPAGGNGPAGLCGLPSVAAFVAGPVDKSQQAGLREGVNPPEGSLDAYPRGPAPRGSHRDEGAPGFEPGLANPGLITGFRLVGLETHHAPAAGPQLRVPAGEPASQRGATATAGIEQARPGPLRHLRIILNPEELGELQVSFRLRGGDLTVDITAHTGRAAEVLRQDAAVLEQVIREAGYDTATLTVRFVEDAIDAATPGHQQRGHERPAGQHNATQWRDPHEEPEPDPWSRHRLPGVFL